MSSSSSFPSQSMNMEISGPSGQLEVAVQFPNGNETHLRHPEFIGIVCHPHPLYGGTMNNKVVTSVAKALNELGIVSVRFNYRGVGQSEGAYGAGIGEAEDLSCVIEWILSHYPQSKICLAGFSFGAYVAVLGANRPEIVSLTTIAPAVNHVDFNALPLPACPWQVILAEKDELVPFQLARHWAEQLSPQPALSVIAEASHFFHGKLLELRAIFKEFVESTL